MCHLFDIWPNIAYVSDSIDVFIAVKNFHRIRHSHDIFDRIHHMWKFRPNFSHLYSPKISHVKYPTEYIKREEFDRTRHRCEQLDLIRHSYDILDKIHHMWKIRPNFSHLYSPIMPRLRYLTDYIKREKFNNILYRCGKNRMNSYKLWHIGQNTSHVKNPTEFLTPIFAENIKCKISDLIGQTWGIRSNTSQMWIVWPNSTKLSHIQQNTSHVKNPTEFLIPIFTDNVTCKIFDQLCQTWEIQWYTTRLWKNRPNSYIVRCDILDRKRHMRKMRSNFSHLYSPKMCHLFDIWPNIAQVSNSIEFYAAVKNFHRIRHSHDIFDRIHHMWKFRPNFSHLYSPKISHVKYPTKYIKREEFDRILHRVMTYSTEFITCEKSDRISHTYIRR